MSKLAIAYAMKKKNKKYAMGGDVETEKEGLLDKVKNWASPAPASSGPKTDSDFAKKVAAGMAQTKAHGGFIEEEKASGFVKHPGNIVKHNGPAISEEAKKLNQLKAIIMDSGEEPTVDGVMHKESEDYSGLDRYAEGGMAGHAYEDDEQGLVDRIMHKHSDDEHNLDRYSEGGKVANDVGTGQEADKDPNQFDDLVLRDDLESTYGDDDNAGDDLGNAQEDEDRKDIVSRIMASRKKKDKNPRPA